ncbi:hypothetical protein D8674_028341 [Pyrus ussuriensis x Pyrus communis]|uniref:Uncharacterized protein n=1 Tax=Pyrus ussuriensis x Pyrus communis TaxID=2448454 RepID=A0A5N5I9C3_9ROSA|nr:hypothetical protein D8674_028341 [Pyrus ussuriensis x Pyrus communis]
MGPYYCTNKRVFRSFRTSCKKNNRNWHFLQILRIFFERESIRGINGVGTKQNTDVVTVVASFPVTGAAVYANCERSLELPPSSGGGGGGETKVMITRVRRRASFRNVSNKITSHICGTACSLLLIVSILLWRFTVHTLRRGLSIPLRHCRCRQQVTLQGESFHLYVTFH